MVADVELEANAIDHEMSNQKQNNTSFLTRQKDGMLWKTGAYLQLYSFIFGIWGNLYLGPLFDHGSWQLFQSCKSCAEAFGVEIWPQMGETTRTAWKTQSLAACYVDFKTVAPVGLARLGWLLRQAKPSLDGS